MAKIILMTLAILFGAGSAMAITVKQDGKDIELPICGGFPGFKCNADQWCDYPDDAICGGVDRLGMCKRRPQVCHKAYIPVCGCDGKTYGNACEAASAGTDAAHAGVCRSR